MVLSRLLTNSQYCAPIANNRKQSGNDIPAFALAALTAGGGITGYARTGSIPSIVAGCTVGALVCFHLAISCPIPFLHVLASREGDAFTNRATLQYALGGYRIRNKEPYGVELALLASVVLAGSSIPRAIRSQKPLPVGLSVLAIYGLVQFGSAWNGRIR